MYCVSKKESLRLHRRMMQCIQLFTPPRRNKRRIMTHSYIR